MLMVHFTVIMVQAIGHHKVAGLQLIVVPCYLVKSGLVNFHLWSLAFHQQINGTIGIEHHHIITLFQLVDGQLFFSVDQTFGKFF